MVPYADARGMAMTALAHDVTLIKAAIYEMLFTAVYTWIHFSSRNSRDTFKGLSGPLSLGIFYALSHIILVSVLKPFLYFFTPSVISYR